MSEGLLEALLPDQGPRARHSRGWDVLQGGGRREGGVPKAGQTHSRGKRWIQQGRRIRDKIRATGPGQVVMRGFLKKMKV